MKLWKEFKKAHPELASNWRGAGKRSLPAIECLFHVRLCIYHKRVKEDGETEIEEVYTSREPLSYPTILLASDSDHRYVEIIQDLMKF